MQATAPHPFETWGNFYVIVGSSSAALTGLQFVVITLVKESWHRPSAGEIGTYATPTVFHFCAALFVSATLSAPWPALLGPQLLVGLCGLAGSAYAPFITWRGTHGTGYRLVRADWVWFVVLPLLAYLAQVGGAITLATHPTGALLAIAGAALLLLYVGIHNAWDTTTYVVSGRAAAEASERKDQTTPADERSAPPNRPHPGPPVQ